MSSQQTHLQTFTSILTLLSVQYPFISTQLQYLRTVVIKWHQQVQQQKMHKNRAILAAKTRGNQKLAVLLQNIQNYFTNLFRCYNDPNLKHYYHQFKKLKQQFQFPDIDILANKHKKSKFKTIQTQTQENNITFFGIDMHKLMKNLQDKQFQLQEAKNKICQVQEEKCKLGNVIANLSKQMKEIQNQYTEKVQQLRQYLEKTKAQAQAITSRCQTQKKIAPNYRSTPEILHQQFMSSRKMRKNLLTNAYQNSLIHQVQEENVDIQPEPTTPTDTQMLRLIQCQALALQGILETISSYQKQNENS